MQLRLWAILGLSVFAALPAAHAAPIVVQKVYDFPGVAGAPWNPYDTPTVIGNELWFTTQGGGENAFGTLSKYNLETGTVTNVFAGFDNTNGNTPVSSITHVGENLYYTTSRGGTGDRGTVNVYNTTTNTNTVLFNSPSNAAPSQPHLFHGGVTYVDRGNGTASLYAMYQSGGTSPGIGGIQKLTLDISTQAIVGSSLVHSFAGGDSHGRQPFEGFTRVGNKLYFTTFTGGPESTGFGNGAGVLGVLDLTDDSVNDALALFPGNGDNFGFGAHNPTYDPITNALYIGMVGTASQPGGIMKYDIATGELTPVFALDDRTGSGANGTGAWIYGSMVLIQGVLYFATTDGGANDSGTLASYNLVTGEFTKIADMDSSTGDNLGGEVRGGPAVVFDGSEYNLYFLARQGGTSDKGTIVQVTVPEPGSATLALAGACALGLVRRRRTA